MRLIMMYKANKLYAARQPWLQANILSIVSKEIYHPINGKLPSFNHLKTIKKNWMFERL